MKIGDIVKVTDERLICAGQVGVVMALTNDNSCISVEIFGSRSFFFEDQVILVDRGLDEFHITGGRYKGVTLFG